MTAVRVGNARDHPEHCQTLLVKWVAGTAYKMDARMAARWSNALAPGFPVAGSVFSCRSGFMPRFDWGHRGITRSCSCGGGKRTPKSGRLVGVHRVAVDDRVADGAGRRGELDANVVVGHLVLTH